MKESEIILDAYPTGLEALVDVPAPVVEPPSVTLPREIFHWYETMNRSEDFLKWVFATLVRVGSRDWTFDLSDKEPLVFKGDLLCSLIVSVPGKVTRFKFNRDTKKWFRKPLGVEVDWTEI